MNTDNLRRNDLSPEAYDWYLRYLAALDAQDLDAYSAFLADDCEMFMNNDGPISGKPAVLGMLGPYWKSFAALEHELLAIIGDDRGWVLEALNHYRRHDGKAVTVRAVAITERNDRGKARSVRLYTDASPVFTQEPA